MDKEVKAYFACYKNAKTVNKLINSKLKNPREAIRKLGRDLDYRGLTKSDEVYLRRLRDCSIRYMNLLRKFHAKLCSKVITRSRKLRKRGREEYDKIMSFHLPAHLRGK